MRELSETSSDESGWNKCFVKINGKFVEVVDGYVNDPNTKQDTKLDFFYLSDCNKMVHMDFEDALIEINSSLKYHQCRPTFKRNRQFQRYSDNYSLLLNKLEKLQEAIGRSKCHGCHHTNEVDGSDEQRIENANVQRESSQKNSSANVSLSSTANRTYLIHSNSSTSIHTTHDSERLLPLAQPLSESQFSKRGKRESSFYISADDLRIIGKWASKNRDFISYKGMEKVPEGTFETDDQYFFKLIFSINPTVVLDRNLPKVTKSLRKIHRTPRKNYAESDDVNEMSQLEFARNLGLVHSQSVSSNLGPSPIAKSKACRQLDQAYVPHNRNSVADRNNGIDWNNESNKENSKVAKNFEQFSKLNNWKSKHTPSTKESDGSPRRNLRQFRKCDYSNTRDKMLYTAEEDRIILKWILRGANSTKVNGNTVWKELEQEKIMPNRARTWQSLRNRFLKIIMSQLRQYGLNNAEMLAITKGAQTGKKTGERTPSPKKISPSRITYVERPKSRKQRKTDTSDVYSDTDELNDNAPGTSFMEYKNKLRENSSRKNNMEPQLNTRSKARKLFTQTTFTASISDKLSVKID